MKCQTIDLQLVSALAQQVQTNKQLLKSIIKTVIFCGKKNFALHGHRDDLQHLQQPGNHGNLLFLASEQKLGIRHFKHIWTRHPITPDIRELFYCSAGFSFFFQACVQLF